MTRTISRFAFPLLLAPVLLAAGCSRPQPTPDEVAGPISPPALRFGTNPPGGVSSAPTGGAGGGSAAGSMVNEVERIGGPMETQTVSAPNGDQIVQNGGHRMSPTTDNAGENDSSSGSGTDDAGSPIPPNVPLRPRYAPGADMAPAAAAAPSATAAPLGAPAGP